MYELIYTSIAVKEFNDSELLEILTQARINNEKHDITGMLVYKNREFAQILQGEEERVRRLYQNIENDERHTSVKLFHENIIENRTFSKWSMSFLKLNNDLYIIPGNSELDISSSIEEALSKDGIGKDLFSMLHEQFIHK